MKDTDQVTKEVFAYIKKHKKVSNTELYEFFKGRNIDKKIVQEAWGALVYDKFIRLDGNIFTLKKDPNKTYRTVHLIITNLILLAAIIFWNFKFLVK